MCAWGKGCAWLLVSDVSGRREMLNDVMTVSEVAEYLRVNPQTVYRKAKAGEMPVVRIGRAIRFRRAELEDWLRDGSKMRAKPWVAEDLRAVAPPLTSIGHSGRP